MIKLNACPAEMRLPLIKQRDADQQIHGMEKAAEIVRNQERKGRSVIDAILSAISELKEKGKVE